MRETYIFKTPSGIDVEIYTFLTERENRQIRALFLQSVEQVESPHADGGFANKIIDKAFQDKVDDLLVSLFVVRYGETTDKARIIEQLLDGPKEDFDFVREEMENHREKKTKK